MMELGTDSMGTGVAPNMSIRELEITDNGPDGITVIRLTGPLLKGEAAVVLRRSVQELIAEGAYKLAVDLERISDIDSSGLGALASAHNCARETGGEVRFFRAGPRVMRILHITHLDRALELFADERSALSGF